MKCARSLYLSLLTLYLRCLKGYWIHHWIQHNEYICFQFGKENEKQIKSLQYCCTGIFNKRFIYPGLWSIMITGSIKDNTKIWINWYLPNLGKNHLNLILHFVGVVSRIITNSNYIPITFIYVVSKYKLKNKGFFHLWCFARFGSIYTI